MKISSKTRISSILRHNMEAVEAIASINPHFRKLRNPVLRNILAPRVTVADAARIGKCSVDLMLDKLAAIGFEIDSETATQPLNGAALQHPAIEAAVRAGNVEQLDVRPALEQGVDPFEIIMTRLKSVPDGRVLELINSFEPVPLLKILHKRGYLSQVITQDDAVHTLLLKTAFAPASDPEGPSNWTRIPFAELERKHGAFDGRTREVDVRDLEMPLPMLTILSELENLPENHALFVHHKKIPQYLLPELADRHFTTWLAEIEPDNVKMLIHR